MKSQQQQINTQNYIFNDIYGSEKLKDKYINNRTYTYYNTLLKIHNRYYDNSNIYSDIFRQADYDNFNQNHYSLPIRKVQTRLNRTQKKPIKLLELQTINSKTYKLKINDNLLGINLEKRKLKHNSEHNQKGRSIDKDRLMLTEAMKNIQTKKTRLHRSQKLTKQILNNRKIETATTTIIIKNTSKKKKI